LSQVLGYNYSSSREQIVSMPVVLCSPHLNAVESPTFYLAVKKRNFCTRSSSMLMP
jgi:hypothetical protein